MYLGSLNVPAGRVAAKKIVELVQGTGKVLVVTSSPTEANSRDRVDGFTTGLQGTQVQHEIYYWGDEYTAYVKAQPDPAHPAMDINAFLSDHLRTVFASDSRPAAIFATNGTDGPVVANTVVESGMTGKIHVVAFDLAADTQRFLQSRVIDATIVQKSYFFGYLSVYVLYAMAVNGTEATMQTLAPWLSGDLMDTGVDLVTPDTLDAYTLYQTNCLGIFSL